MNDREEVKRLMKEAKSHVDSDNLKKAGEKLHQAINIAESVGDKELVARILKSIQEFTYTTETQTVELPPLNTDGLILDIGGGGEGIIGRLGGKRVVAIDTNERELLETENEALKVVMDAADLKFLQGSFDLCTSFFTLLYIPKSRHLKVFTEISRVLKDNGKFLLWDVKIPSRIGGFKAFMVQLKVKLPNDDVEAGYGVKWQTQDISYFKRVARKAGFNVVREWSKGEIFHLEMEKT